MFLRRTRALTIVIVAIAFDGALACLSGGALPHHIDQSRVGIDNIAPEKPHVQVERIERGKNPISLGNGVYRGLSTDDIGTVDFRITGMSDNDTAPEKMGVHIVALDTLSAVGRELPPDADVCPGYLAKDKNWALSLIWTDGPPSCNAPISARFLFYAVDSAGNLSSEPDTVLVAHAGRQ